ncbi:bifunctional diguanylate cyclase/phosphodiesterase [Peribacillus sp. NPDC097675]|uniref:bifunctional diguanylate cyclase/phosphodiesterase n=1 Tax=Peribacillus sp. NPDC097675 TaxID=3390618 RepID=UPI003D02EECE
MHIQGSYNTGLVILSFFIVALASYSASAFVGRIAHSQQKAQQYWLLGGAVTLGLGIWSMHFVGMLALQIHETISYEYGKVLLSIAIAIFASWVSLFFISRETMNRKQLLMGSTALGSAILTMHYTGMAAMRMSASIQYNPHLVFLSVVIACIASVVALKIGFRYKHQTASRLVEKTVSASIMGIAVAGTHYTGMAAATYHSDDMVHTTSSALPIGTFLLGLGIGSAILFIQIMVIFIINFDKKMTLQNKELRLTQQKFDSLVTYNPDIIFRMNRDGKLETINPAISGILGYTFEDIQKLELESLVSEEVWKECKNYCIDTLRGTLRSFEIEALHKNNTKVALNILTIPVYVDHEIIGINGIAKDITEQKAALAKVNYMAYYDELTGLPNRRAFKEKANILIQQNGEEMAALLLMDINRFKTINDTLGHGQGDLFIKEIAKRFNECLEPGGFLARIGVDEFTVFLPKVTGLEQAEIMAQKLLHSLDEPIKINTHEIYTTTCIGISAFPKDGMNIGELIKRADLAMFLGKGTGDSSYKFFTESMESRLDKIQIEEEMRTGIHKDDEFILYFQPKIDTRTGTISGAEALVRWNHPRLGFVSPAEFIPLAEETGLIIQLGEKILDLACAQLHEWHKVGFDSIHIAVNISTRQFMQVNFIEKLKRMLDKWNIEGKNLELEITESTAMNNVNRAIFTFERLRELGVKIAIDDFGTGYSSFAYLKDYPINTLKIDQSFIRNLATGGPDEAIVASIIGLAKNMQLNIVAEGVENQIQFDFLKELDCNQVQGYMFSKPLPAHELEERFLRSSNVIPAG